MLLQLFSMAVLSFRTLPQRRMPGPLVPSQPCSIHSLHLASSSVVSHPIFFVHVQAPDHSLPAGFLATGIVILISIAIAAGVVFVLALIGILWTLFSRTDESQNKLVPAEYDDDDDSAQHRPSSLLEHINAATRTTILGAANPFISEKDEKGAAGAGANTDGPDASNYVRAETPSDAVGGVIGGGDETSRPAYARYSFDGSGEGELPLSTGMEVEVLDDRDAAYVLGLRCLKSNSHVRLTVGGMPETLGQVKKVWFPLPISTKVILFLTPSS